MVYIGFDAFSDLIGHARRIMWSPRLIGRLVIAAALCISAAPPSPASGESALASGRGGAGEWTSGSGHGLRNAEEAQGAALAKCGGEAKKPFCDVGGRDADTPTRVNVQQLVLTWIECFTRDARQAPATKLAACDKLGAFSSLGEKERVRVVRRREELVKLRDDTRE